ncbi:hypothetical protein B0H19DRAFT_1265422 [Mycena capillaripes]|nr:hypothetical protein B0H19DRAFT_1265422 [Mycena capillaripes]
MQRASVLVLLLASRNGTTACVFHNRRPVLSSESPAIDLRSPNPLVPTALFPRASTLRCPALEKPIAALTMTILVLRIHCHSAFARTRHPPPSSTFPDLKYYDATTKIRVCVDHADRPNGNEERLGLQRRPVLCAAAGVGSLVAVSALTSLSRVSTFPSHPFCPTRARVSKERGVDKMLMQKQGKRWPRCCWSAGTAAEVYTRAAGFGLAKDIESIARIQNLGGASMHPQHVER